MGIYNRPWMREGGFQPRAPQSGMPKSVKVLLWVNIGVYLVQILFFKDPAGFVPHRDGLGLSPIDVISKFKVWELVTSMFLHDPVQPFHLLLNMFVLWMFGPPVARRLGDKPFLKLYFGSGIVASLAFVLIGQFTHPGSVAIGASGAIMGVVIYFTMMAPNAPVLLFFIIPLKMKWVALMIVGMDLVMFLTGAGGNVAHTAHLGGALFGFLYYRYAHRIDRFFTKMEVGAGKIGSGPKKKDREPSEEDQRELNRLLDKINEEGFASLSKREKKFLMETSRRLRESER